MKTLLLVCFFIAYCVLTSPPHYSESIASKAIQLSTAIYNISKADRKANQCPDCYPQFEPISQIQQNKILTVIVTFRGSDNVRNFITDVRMIMTSYDNDNQCQDCKLHKGFYKSYSKLVKDGLQTAIKQTVDRYPNFGILFTGHSLGGALALIAAVKFAESSHLKNIQVYTLGQPRVGNQEYANYADKMVSDTYRIIYKKDIVPHKPSYIAFYRHSGYEVWYLDGMDNDYQGCKADSNYCSNSLGSRNVHYSVQDHGSINYLQLYYNTQIHRNIYQSFKENSEGEELKQQFANNQNQIDWDQEAQDIQETDDSSL